MEIKIYNNTSNKNVLNKNLTPVNTLSSCELTEESSAVNPVVTLDMNTSIYNANYAYIAYYGRYYYIEDVTTLDGLRLRVRMRVDVLMSFKSGILSAPAVISRNPWHFDLYLPDNRLPIETRTASAIQKFNTAPFSGTNNTFVLTTLGG